MQFLVSPLWPCLFLLTPWSYHSSCKVVFPTDVRGGETTQKAPLTCRIVPSVGCTSTTRGAYVRSKPQSHLLLQGLGSKRTSKRRTKRCIMHSLFSNALSLVCLVVILRFRLLSISPGSNCLQHISLHVSAVRNRVVKPPRPEAACASSCRPDAS